MVGVFKFFNYPMLFKLSRESREAGKADEKDSDKGKGGKQDVKDYFRVNW